jgi:hypothetical protein
MAPSSRIGAALVWAVACALACAANDVPGSAVPVAPAVSDSTIASWLGACEVALQQLDALLSACDSSSTAALADAAEARSLRREALDLMAAFDYELAFDLIARAISVLERAP